ncbi:Fe2+-dependent dioxygenase [Ferrovibrio sp.]|uniref:Fe2+-dependent dioxygenase n=1 Tax=Ferrovibrio sp. TaxID=1917215 RepID=UPI0035B05F85
MILQIPDVLTPEEVLQIRQALQQAAWRDGSETAGHVAIQVKHNQQLANDDPLAIRLGEFILQRLGQIERFIAAALPLKILPPRFNRHAGGGTYGYHVDNAIFTLPGSSQCIRSDLSATLFLSDPADYDGGELQMQGLGDVPPIKLPAGHMVLYPATTLHQVRPVTRGERLGAFFWVQSLVREAERRALLLELDDTIRDLRGDHPEHGAGLRLTGLYHNLLRQWSET